MNTVYAYCSLYTQCTHTHRRARYFIVASALSCNNYRYLPLLDIWKGFLYATVYLFVAYW